MARKLDLLGAALLAPALACQAGQGPSDAGCVDAGLNTVCGGPQAFDVRFAGFGFPLLDDAGNPTPNVLDVILADRDLSSACSGDGSKLPSFTAVDIVVNGYAQPVDAGTYTSPTASAYEISWVPDAGPSALAESDDTWVSLTKVTGQVAQGYFTAQMAIPTSGTVPMWGDFQAKSCQGLHTAISPPP
ncbi:MAG: hypothetical protein ACYDCL_22520 [Myxococcales bacterium]